MSNLFWLTDAQMARLTPFFPKSHGILRVDDRRVLSGIIFINRNGLRCCDVPREYGLPKPLYSRWKRWSDKRVFARMMDGLASEAAVPQTVMINVSGYSPLVRACPRKCLKAHRTATNLRSKRGTERPKGSYDRSNEGRHEHQGPCRHRCGWPSDPVLHDGRPGQRIHGCSRADGLPAKGGVAAGRPGL